MIRPTLPLACAFSLALLGLAPSARSADPAPAVPAAAAPAPRKPKQADVMLARFEVQLGKAAAQKKQFAPALEHFEKAHKLDPIPASAIGRAAALRGLARPLDALAAYEAVLADHTGQLKPAEQAEVEKAIAELSASAATLTLKPASPLVEVTLDGKPIDHATLAKPLRLPPGRHVVRATAPDCDPFEKEIDAVVGQSLTLDVAPQPAAKTGRLVVTGPADGEVHVFVDGEDRGAPPWEGDVPAGPHAIELRGPTLASPKKTVDVLLRGRSEAALEPVARTGRLAVLVRPETAKISVDGAAKGDGHWEGELPIGPHEVEAAAAGRATEKRSVVIADGERTALELALPVALGGAVADKPAKSGKDEPKKDAKSGNHGVYFALDLFAGRPSTSPSYACAARDRCDTTEVLTPLGAGLVGRGGFWFDWLGVEAVGAALGDLHLERNSYKGEYGANAFNVDASVVDATFKREEAFLRYSLGGFAGLGVRASTRTTLRASGGVALGAAYRHFALTRKETGLVDDTYSASKSYLAPALLADVGVAFGIFRLGVLAWVDKPPSGFATPSDEPHPVTVGDRSYNLQTPAFALTSGTQFYIGPTLGMELGY